MAYEPRQEVRWWHKVRVKHAHQVTLGCLKSKIEGSGLEAIAPWTVKDPGIDAVFPKAVYFVFGNGGCVISRVVENLEFEAICRPIHGSNCSDQSRDDCALIEHGKLNGDVRKILVKNRRIVVGCPSKEQEVRQTM